MRAVALFEQQLIGLCLIAAGSLDGRIFFFE
jgi:hypothetical protein